MGILSKKECKQNKHDFPYINVYNISMYLSLFINPPNYSLFITKNPKTA